jgi:hypothetical protein
MRKVLIKILPLLLCGLLIYNSLGHLVALRMIHRAYKQQMWLSLGRIKTSDLTTFVFKSNNKSRLIVLNKHEIIVDGRLYDVVKKTVSKKQTTYVCINDRQEEKLLAKIKQLNQDAQQLPQGKLAWMIVDNIIKSAIAGQKNAATELCSSVTYRPFENPVYQVPGIQRFLPPPEHLV